jgi:hypothetical protein
VQEIFVFSIYDYGVMSVYKLSVKWHIDVEPSFRGLLGYSGTFSEYKNCLKKDDSE